MREPLRFSGVMPANLLPFRADLAIDEPAYRRHLKWLVDTPGVTGIVANGHAAEVASLSREERRHALDLDQRFRPRGGERAQARREAAREDQRLFDHVSRMRVPDWSKPKRSSRRPLPSIARRRRLGSGA